MKSAKKTFARSSSHLGVNIHFPNWFECSSFCDHISSKLGNFPLNLLGQNFAAQEKKNKSRNRIIEYLRPLLAHVTGILDCTKPSSLLRALLLLCSVESITLLLHYYLMKYTLGRADLSRAHHMLLMHHNFSTQRHIQKA